MIHDFSMHGWGMGWGWLLILILIGIFIWVLIKVFIRAGQSKMAGSKNPLDILKERYAKGEITREEFEERKKDLS
jgi:putative membrane protein